LAPSSGTLAFKTGLLAKLLRRYSFIDTVRVWDDRRSHIPKFVATALRMGIAPENIHTTHVRARSKAPLCEEGEFEIQPSKKPSYIAAFLDAKSRAKLTHDFPYLHDKARADHMTISRAVTPDLLEWVGRPLRMKVVGYAENDRIQAVVVEPDRALGRESRIPHVTLSHAPGVPSKESNDLLAGGYDRVNGPVLSGIVDVFPRSLTPSQKVALQYLWNSR